MSDSRPMHTDTRNLLRVGGGILLTGLASAALLLTALGGVTRGGPHTSLGWMALVVAIGCLPLGTLTLLLGVAKLFGDRNR